MSERDLPEILNRIALGDPQAADELVRRYEPEIRRAVRVRLTDPRLRRVLDSVDVCQSVFANFFVRASLGQFDLQHSADPAALLVSMARNKLLDHVRRLQSLKRDQRRLDLAAEEALATVAESARGPEQLAVERDLVAEVRRRLDTDERQIADLRAEGLEWDEIAAQVGAKPDALRKKLTRALDRVTRQLGLEELSS